MNTRHIVSSLRQFEESFMINFLVFFLIYAFEKEKKILTIKKTYVKLSSKYLKIHTLCFYDNCLINTTSR